MMYAIAARAWSMAQDFVYLNAGPDLPLWMELSQDQRIRFAVSFHLRAAQDLGYYPSPHVP